MHINEIIDVLNAYNNNQQLEIKNKNDSRKEWKGLLTNGYHNFNFQDFDYRIKEQKQTITMEKWLCATYNEFDIPEYWTCESTNIDTYIEHIGCIKVKLLESYQIEL